MAAPSWLKWFGAAAAVGGAALVAKQAAAATPARPGSPVLVPGGVRPAVDLFPYDPTTGAPTFLDGVDVSAAQGSVNWPMARDAAKLSFAISKTTQGEPGKPYGFVDGTWVKNRVGMRDHLLFWGGYSYAIFARDPIVSADAFCTAIGDPDDRMIPPAIDAEWEYNNGLSPKAAPFPKPSAARVIDYLYAWEERVRRNLGRRSMIYCNAGFWNFIGTPIDPIQKAYLLWNAVWTSASSPTPVPGFDPYTFWQWSAEQGPLGHVPIPGIAGHSVDRDRFRGNTDDMRRMIEASKV